jgi:hypothetical protein
MQASLDSKLLKRYRKRFLRIFPNGFYDEQYLLWEHNYKWHTHKLWTELLDKEQFFTLVRAGAVEEIAKRALKVESSCKPPFLFSFEKMALRDALQTATGARLFSDGLYELLHGRGSLRERFVQWIVSVSQLPRKQSRVLSWPILTFFPYVPQPTSRLLVMNVADRKQRSIWEMGS